MQAKEKEKLLRKLDAEMRTFRRAAKEVNPTNGLLWAVRTALRIPVKEIAEKLEVKRCAVFELEASEVRNSISLRALTRMAEAMECQVVYGIVPKYGKTMEGLAEERHWRKGLEKSREQKSREQGLRD